MTTQRHKILEDATFFISATYIAQLGTFVTGIITRRFLGPTNTGIWSLMIILMSYLPVIQLGLIDAVAVRAAAGKQAHHIVESPLARTP